MADKPLIYNIYGDLVASVDGICERVFLDRPKITQQQYESFIVVDLPTDVRNRLKGRFGVMLDCLATYTVFRKAKPDDTLDIFEQSEDIQKVLDVFPINRRYVSAVEPKVLMQGSDGYGYQSTQIVFKLRTKFNANNN